MNECKSCTAQYDSDFNAIVKRKKELYNKNGTEYYIYVENEQMAIIRKEYFTVKFPENAPEFVHISEFEVD